MSVLPCSTWRSAGVKHLPLKQAAPAAQAKFCGLTVRTTALQHADSITVWGDQTLTPREVSLAFGLPIHSLKMEDDGGEPIHLLLSRQLNKASPTGWPADSFASFSLSSVYQSENKKTWQEIAWPFAASWP